MRKPDDEDEGGVHSSSRSLATIVGVISGVSVDSIIGGWFGILFGGEDAIVLYIVVGAIVLGIVGFIRGVNFDRDWRGGNDGSPRSHL